MLQRSEQTANQFLNPLEAILSRFKVIHQITLIILIMIAFLVIQGGLTLYTFNRMQKVSQTVFNSSIQGFQSTAIIRRELAIIRNQYTLSLYENQPLFVSFVDLDSALASLNTGVKTDSEAQTQLDSALEQLNQQIAGLKKQVDKPVDRAIYNKVDAILNEMTVSVKAIEDVLTSNALLTMQKGNDFFTYSRNTTILIVILSALLSLAIGLAIAAMISNPLEEMVRVVGLMAKGDFTNLIKLNGSREVKKLVDGLNHAILSLRQLVRNINEQAKALAMASKELNNSSHEAGRSAAEVARAMETMARAASEQANQMSLTANNVAELGQLVRKVTQDSISIAESSKQVSNSAKTGQHITTDVAAEIGEIYNNTKEISMVIDDVNRTSEEIKVIIKIIENIAEQTTLLALNAAIEAARAGEHGRGFNVVATETGKLAERSKQASQQINELIIQMIKRSSHAVQVIQKGVNRVEAGKALSTEATATFEKIFNELETTFVQIHNVARSAQQIAAYNEQVVEAVTSVATISEEGMATAEEVSATAEQQSASAQEVAGFAENLAMIAETMQQAVLAFKI
ncbi:MAG TPA: methyl-accepting chemotaxis protein [Bacillota bacterium]